ncbi:MULTISPECIES: hypothetical protein [unclassified Psychrobacter]|uniref:hypothetical protein n=1 Tax=unclassified Psychrobacter TaxID=196806 RepID=UPI0018F3337A|nr:MULTISPECIES: hypothetical protein [unclassified Psychrobacter]
MKLVKLTAVSAAVLVSTAAMAAEPVAYGYNEDAGVVRNTTGAVVGGTKTFFDTVTHPAAVSAEVGTLGYGANVAWGLNDKTEIQAGWAGGDVADLFGGDFDANDVNYDVDTDFSNPYLGVQLRPAANWFTVGAGIIVPDNDITATANAEDAGENGYYPVDGARYYVGTPNADADFDLTRGDLAEVGSVTAELEHRNKLAPYATIGFRPNITNNFGVFGELGAAYLGKTTAKVNASGAGGALAEEKIKQELEDEDYLEWMPIVKLGATYRF